MFLLLIFLSFLILLHLSDDIEIFKVVVDLEQHAQRTVVVGVGETAVNLGAGEHKSAPFAQRDERAQIIQPSDPLRVDARSRHDA